MLFGAEIWGLKTQAWFDVWSIEHLAMGIGLGSLAGLASYAMAPAETMSKQLRKKQRLSTMGAMFRTTKLMRCKRHCVKWTFMKRLSVFLAISIALNRFLASLPLKKESVLTLFSRSYCVKPIR